MLAVPPVADSRETASSVRLKTPCRCVGGWNWRPVSWADVKAQLPSPLSTPTGDPPASVKTLPDGTPVILTEDMASEPSRSTSAAERPGKAMRVSSSPEKAPVPTRTSGASAAGVAVTRNGKMLVAMSPLAASRDVAMSCISNTPATCWGAMKCRTANSAGVKDQMPPPVLAPTGFPDPSTKEAPGGTCVMVTETIVSEPSRSRRSAAKPVRAMG